MAAKKKAAKKDLKRKKKPAKKADSAVAALERTAASLDAAGVCVKGINVGDRAHQQLEDAQVHLAKAADLLRRQAVREPVLAPPLEG